MNISKHFLKLCDIFVFVFCVWPVQIKSCVGCIIEKNGKKCHWCILLHGCWRNYTEFPRIANIIIVTCVKLSADVIYSSELLHIQRIYQLKNRTRNREKNSAKWASFSQYLYFYYQKRFRVSFLHSFFFETVTVFKGRSHPKLFYKSCWKSLQKQDQRVSEDCFLRKSFFLP